YLARILVGGLGRIIPVESPGSDSYHIRDEVQILNNSVFAILDHMTYDVTSDLDRFPGPGTKPRNIKNPQTRRCHKIDILDISKTLMYDFHYNYIKPKYGDDARLLFTDTDSLCYEIRTEDFFKDISEDVHEKFDTSNL
ncbi:Hypothetical predicted protein, partial [Paramuricea clavata]